MKHELADLLPALLSFAHAHPFADHVSAYAAQPHSCSRIPKLNTVVYWKGLAQGIYHAGNHASKHLWRIFCRVILVVESIEQLVPVTDLTIPRKQTMATVRKLAMEWRDRST